MLTKEEFVEHLKIIMDWENRFDCFVDSFESVSEDCYGGIFAAKLIDSYVHLLEKTVGDDAEWVSWWLWELGGNVVTVDGIDYTIDSPEKLYDLITNNLEESKDGNGSITN